MIEFDDIKLYLPKQLSYDSTRELIKALRDFPYNIDKRMYTSALNDDEVFYQGDGLKSAIVVNLPDLEPVRAPVMILSNSCDISIKNRRQFMSSNAVYATIFRLSKYRNALLEEGIEAEESIDSHIDDIKKQKLTQIFYLPKGGQLEEDSIVFFDRVNNCPVKAIEQLPIRENRIFTLSNYGFYLFLFKLSIHLTRMTEGLDRKIDCSSFGQDSMN